MGINMEGNSPEGGFSGGNWLGGRLTGWKFERGNSPGGGIFRTPRKQ